MCNCEICRRERRLGGYCDLSTRTVIERAIRLSKERRPWYELLRKEKRR